MEAFSLGSGRLAMTLLKTQAVLVKLCLDYEWYSTG